MSLGVCRSASPKLSVAQEKGYEQVSSAPATATVAPGKRSKKYQGGGLEEESFTVAKSSDPRAKRLQKLKSSGVLDMQEETAVLLSILPSPLIDTYYRQLKTTQTPSEGLLAALLLILLRILFLYIIVIAAPPIRQAGVPVESESRDVEVNTEEIEIADKGVQFSYGDDTALLAVIDAVKASKKKALRSICESKDGEPLDAHLSASASLAGASASQSVAALVRGFRQESRSGADLVEMEMASNNVLSVFLQKASKLCVSLMEEARGASSSSAVDSRSKVRKVSVFGSESRWKRIGDDATKGANELIRTRNTSCLAFGPLQPNLLMSGHQWRANDEEDLKPYKVRALL